MLSPTATVGIKQVYIFEVIAYSNIYGIETKELQLIKYIKKSTKANHVVLSSRNKHYEDYGLSLTKIVAL